MHGSERPPALPGAELDPRTGAPIRRRAGQFPGGALAALLAFAEGEFALQRAENGASRRAHLEQVARQTGQLPDELGQAPPPAALAHVYDWFLDLSAGRGGTGFGPAPLSAGEIAAWAALSGITLRDHEVRAIRALDRLWLSLAARE
ncbi:phage tail assembly chaperone [Oceanibacterium hippocampi]|uniref:phage tail assembly chaperone n=1 Tax=Oceanibacterium hippocampi TaxID=745714 RepID=UPI003F96823C